MPHHNKVRICPDCGGILQPTGVEALTSSEVASLEPGSNPSTCQCLLCGYIATRDPEERPERESC